jgi:competence protein ComEC
MVIGSKAVDLPYDNRDDFVRVGLAHALAASGFQVS